MSHKDDLLRAAEIAEMFSPHPSVQELASRLRAAAETHVLVPREPKPGLLCGDVAISTDPRYAGFVFVRHVDGVNWTTCAKMTLETWAMLSAAAELEKP